MTEDGRPRSGDPDAVRMPSPDVARDVHAHQTDAEREALADPGWWPARIPELMGALVVLALVLGVTAGVALRATGNGVLGLVELASSAMLVMVVLGAASLSYRDEHVRLELLDAVAGPRLMHFVDILDDLVQLAVVAVVAYALQDLFRSDLSTGTTMGGELDLNRSWLSGTATLGFLLLGLVLLRKTAHDVLHLRKAR